MDTQTKDSLQQLFQQHTGVKAEKIDPLPASGSDRKYFRLSNDEITIIGAYNPNEKENHAFLQMTEHFTQKGIAVPSILGKDMENHTYIVEDLGNETLFQKLANERKGIEFPSSLLPLYQNAVEDLAKIQIKGHEGFDYKNWCYQIESFDKTSMLWDLNYFKYYFFKVSNVPFDEVKLEKDYQRLTNYLQRAKDDYFLFRDFQARNIMIKEGTPYYIDYQGGRKGALQYDLASLLCQAKANIPFEIREQLLQHYIKAAQQLTDIDENEFIRFYYPFVLIRCIQVLGAYGFRGIYERKAHFLTSIPYAIRNLEWVLEKLSKRLKLPYLREVLQRLIDSRDWSLLLPKAKDGRLTVTISSFSYRRGIPVDTSGNGGGHVFDCRAIHNPGRYTPYKRLTGRDKSVQEFLEAKSRIKDFLQDVYDVVEPSVERYMQRGFTSLMVSFGCTGGQHRSVYSADSLAAHLKVKYDINVVVNHVEQELKNWKN